MDGSSLMNTVFVSVDGIVRGCELKCVEKAAQWATKRAVLFQWKNRSGAAGVFISCSSCRVRGLDLEHAKVEEEM